MEHRVSIRLCGLLFVFHCCRTFALVPGEGLPQEPKEVVPDLRKSSEADFRDAIQRVEDLAQVLEARTYREHLQEALHKLGYGPYHPLFRTSLNGFEQHQIDLEAADEFKMGSFAFLLKSEGQVLSPDPFDDWLKVQKRLEIFEPAMEGARNAVARTGILAANATGNMPVEVFRKLSKRWRAAEVRATSAYEHALAVRAVLYSDGELTLAPQTFRLVLDGGQYAVVCVSGACTSQPAGKW
jgi:hypothetical protein